MGKKTQPLILTGVKENNLKNLTLSLPHDELTVITGLSGSGKSSLAFSTVYAEGQRRYIETFSPYTRQFFDKVKPPNALSIENVRPAIAIQQRTKVTGSRSTVGSMTNINDLLKILWSNLSAPFSPKSGKELVRWTPADLNARIAERVKDDLQKATLLIAAPITFHKTKKIKSGEFERYQTLGFTRFFDPADQSLNRFEDFKPSTIPDTIFIVLDRIRAEKYSKSSTYESLKQAFQLTRGSASLLIQPEGKSEYSLEHYHSHYVSPDPNEEPLDFQVPAPRPALFDANSPIGACSECNGFGKVLQIDPDKVVPDTSLSIEEGALQCWNGDSAYHQFQKLLAFCEEEDIPVDRPWNKLSQSAIDQIFETSGRSFKGVRSWFKKMESKAYKMHVRVFLSKYRSQFTCAACGGERLKPEAQIFKLCDRTLGELWDMPIEKALKWLDEVEEKYKKLLKDSRDVKELILQLRTRLSSLVQLGLPYLSLGRQSRTLSGGETQRVNLATALGSGLTSTHFVLDEPSVGLHARDTERLMEAVTALKDSGNSLLVVEHDLDCISAADNVLELGPLAGAQGGEVTYSGPQSGWSGISAVEIESPEYTKDPSKGPFLTIKNANVRNLKGFDVKVPVACLTALTGVSGSGKSTLVDEVILAAYELEKSGRKISRKENYVTGLNNFDQVLRVDQSGLAKSPRANIATYSGIWDVIRAGLAATEAATQRSLTKSSFSFNVDGGRCSVCKGIGSIKEDMQFLSEVYVRCEACLGKRFEHKVLEVTYQDKNADQWLLTTVDECAKELHQVAKVRDICEILSELGLGHLRLGHALSELSGGEAQRLKLVPFLERAGTNPSLLIFDEPTTGLHLHDVARLIAILYKLTDQGHTVLCVEHNLELIKHADWIIDLGPEGGADGGEVLLCGTPTEIQKKKHHKRSYTAKYLAEYSTESKSKPAKKSTAKTTKNSEIPPLTIERAREHNLKNITLDIPHNKVIALTGVSGSGKSTLAKDIIYAEGQRRYLDCLSPYARQFIKELSKPDVDSVSNIRPTICVYQHTFQPGRLSTVGTLSETYNFLRLLYSKLGQQYCPDHPDQRVSALSAEQIAERIKESGSNEVRLLAPIIKGRKGLHKTVFQRAISSQIDEVRVDGVFAPPSQFLDGLERNKVHSIDFVWAKIVPDRVPADLLVEAAQEVFALGGGTLIVHHKDGEEIYSRELACPVCSRGFFTPDPEDFSFHSKRGRCEGCAGTGLTKKGTPCKLCDGSRLKETGQNVRIAGLSISELCDLSSDEVLRTISKLEFDSQREEIAVPIRKEIINRLETLGELSLGYLPLGRSCSHLSNGELQRLRLAAALGTPLSGAVYIFDEPSAGLHPIDNDHVLAQFQKIKDQENTVILIEHDEHTILSSDHIIEVGPGGGAEGGEVIFNDSVKKYPGITCDTKDQARELDPSGELTIKTQELHNIRELDVTLPLGQLITVAGVSGAGKSTLIREMLLETLQSESLPIDMWKSSLAKVASTIPIDRILEVDQSPIGRTSRSTPASYLKVWDEIRKLFALTPLARAQGWGPGFFSYNSGKGRCTECKGLGRIKLEMSFLSEAYVTCDYCGGRRYGDEALTVRYLDKTVDEVLKMTFDEARQLFTNHKKIHRILHCACELGLGYLTLGQSSPTLSGGESQRIKLVTELARPERGHTLYILDEPTVGLHKRDVRLLLNVLHGLVASGNTVIMIEHDSDAIASAHHLIELGPGPGEEGGNVIYQGPPEKVIAQSTPWGKILSAQMKNVA